MANRKASLKYQLLIRAGTKDAVLLYAQPDGEGMDFNDSAYEYEQHQTPQAIEARFVSGQLTSDQLQVMVPPLLPDGQPNPDYTDLYKAPSLVPALLEVPEEDEQPIQ